MEQKPVAAASVCDSIMLPRGTELATRCMQHAAFSPPPLTASLARHCSEAYRRRHACACLHDMVPCKSHQTRQLCPRTHPMAKKGGAELPPSVVLSARIHADTSAFNRSSPYATAHEIKCVEG